MKKRCMLFLIVILLLVTLTSAHGNEELQEHEKEGIGIFHVSTGVLFIEITAAILILISFIVIPFREHLNDSTKKMIFVSLTVIILFSSVYFAASIVSENVTSVTKGPVHWHADYEVWVCGEKIDLVNPKFPSNKIGSPLFHEHNDDRIHVEGTVSKLSDVDFGTYFEVIGGELKDGHMIYPGADNHIDVKNGDACPDGTQGRLKVYVNGQLEENYNDYLMYPDSYVPPGDCIIVAFDGSTSQTTDKLCTSWESEGWDYENYKEKREPATIGGHTWQ